MSSSASQPSPQQPNRRFPPDVAAAYPPPGSASHEFPVEGPLYTPKPKRQLDRLVGTVITCMVVLAVFAVLVALLTNISPDSPTELVPDEVRPDASSAMEEPDQTIYGD